MNCPYDFLDDKIKKALKVNLGFNSLVGSAAYPQEKEVPGEAYSRYGLP